MMQANEMKQRLSQVENTIHHAADRCKSATGVPMELKNCIQEMDQRVSQTGTVMQSQDETQIRKFIDEMEQMGDRAKDACEDSSVAIDGELKDAVMQAHRELSDLKHQIH